jgi:hypothetical protein
MVSPLFYYQLALLAIICFHCLKPLARKWTASQIMYHPQSGWFEEGPQRGPATRRKGLKALKTPCCRCVGAVTSSLPCRLTADNGDTGTCMGAICRMKVVVR